MCNVRQALRNPQIPVTNPPYQSGKSQWFWGEYPKPADHLSFSLKWGGGNFATQNRKSHDGVPHFLWQALWFSCMWLRSSGQIGTIIPEPELNALFLRGGIPLRNPPHLGWPTGGVFIARCNLLSFKESTNKTGDDGSKVSDVSVSVTIP